MPTTAKHALPYPSSAAVPNVPADMQSLADAVDAKIVAYSTGTFAGRPAPGVSGRMYRCTDTLGVFLDNGTSWEPLQNGRRGKSIIATAEARTNAAYGTLTTPDQVTGVVLPTDGLLFVSYQALWQCSSGVNGRAAIFLGANQLKVRNFDNSVSIVTQAAAHDPTFNSNTYEPLSSCPIGLMSGDSGSAGVDDVTTGQVLGGYASSPTAHAMDFGGSVVNDLPLHHMVGGVCVIEAAAGTYDVSIRFASTPSGTVTVKNRKLRVWTMGFDS